MFVIALSTDNQWTVEWHTWLPPHQPIPRAAWFPVSSKRPLLVCACQKSFLGQRSLILIIVEKCYPWKIC